MRLPRFRIRSLMIAVAAVAVACAWPSLFVFIASIALGAILGLGVVFTTAGRKLFEWCAVAYVVVLLIVNLW